MNVLFVGDYATYDFIYEILHLSCQIDFIPDAKTAIFLLEAAETIAYDLILSNATLEDDDEYVFVKYQCMKKQIPHVGKYSGLILYTCGNYVWPYERA